MVTKLTNFEQIYECVFELNFIYLPVSTLNNVMSMYYIISR